MDKNNKKIKIKRPKIKINTMPIFISSSIINTKTWILAKHNLKNAIKNVINSRYKRIK